MKYWEIEKCNCACHRGGRCGRMCAGVACSCGLQGCGVGTIEHVIQEHNTVRSWRMNDPTRKVIILNDQDSTVTRALQRKRFPSNKEEDWLKK